MCCIEGGVLCDCGNARKVSVHHCLREQSGPNTAHGNRTGASVQGTGSLYSISKGLTIALKTE